MCSMPFKNYKSSGDIAKAVYKNGKWMLSFGWHLGSLNKKNIVIYKGDLMEQFPASSGNGKVPAKEGAVQILPSEEGVYLVKTGKMKLGPREVIPEIRLYLDKVSGNLYELIYFNRRHRIAMLKSESWIRSILIESGDLEEELLSVMEPLLVLK